LDVLGRPRRRALGQLSFFASDEEEAEKLAEMASPGGSDVFFAYIEQEARSWVDVLMDFPSVHVPLPHLLEMVGPIRPRSFSIASGPSALPGHLELLVARLQFSTRFGAKREGLCSSWLATLPASSSSSRVPVTAGGGGPGPGPGKGGGLVAMYLVPGSFRIPDDPTTPVIMVGPGTGVAPMRSLLMEREAMMKMKTRTKSTPERMAANVPPHMLVSDPEDEVRRKAMHESPEAYAGTVRPSDVGWRLFFGCRRHDSDYYYSRDWLRFVQRGVLDGLHTAFSRSSGSHKVYVTKRLLEQGAWLGRCLVESQARVYIAGSANRMPSDVKEVLEGCI